MCYFRFTQKEAGPSDRCFNYLLKVSKRVQNAQK